MIKSTHYIDGKFHIMALSSGGRTEFYARKRSMVQSLGLWLETCRIDFLMGDDNA